jgi:hypothetical protein
MSGSRNQTCCEYTIFVRGKAACWCWRFRLLDNFFGFDFPFFFTTGLFVRLMREVVEVCKKETKHVFVTDENMRDQ